VPQLAGLNDLKHMRSLTSQIRNHLLWPLLSTLGSCDFAPEMAKTHVDEHHSTRRAEEVDQTIRELVTYEHGLLSVHNPVLKTIYIIPSTISWTVECGVIGFRMKFGSDSEGLASVILSYRSIPTESCRSLALTAARVVATVADSNAPKKSLRTEGLKPLNLRDGLKPDGSVSVDPLERGAVPSEPRTRP